MDGDDATPHPEIGAIVAALLGGGRYGLKIRLPHALVMTILFKRKLSAKDKLRVVLKLALEHASNLAAFATLYKTILAVLKLASRGMSAESRIGNAHSEGGFLQWIGRTIIRFIVDGTNGGRRLMPRAPGLPERSHHALIAGAIGGYVVWGRNSAINYQIVLYLASRIAVGCMTLAGEKGVPPFCWKGMSSKRTYPIAAAAIWGIVMLLFEEHPNVLHPSLKKSMDEVYRFLPFGSQATGRRRMSGASSRSESQRWGAPRSLTSGLSNIDFIEEYM